MSRVVARSSETSVSEKVWSIPSKLNPTVPVTLPSLTMFERKIARRSSARAARCQSPLVFFQSKDLMSLQMNVRWFLCPVCPGFSRPAAQKGLDGRGDPGYHLKRPNGWIRVHKNGEGLIFFRQQSLPSNNRGLPQDDDSLLSFKNRLRNRIKLV